MAEEKRSSMEDLIAAANLMADVAATEQQVGESDVVMPDAKAGPTDKDLERDIAALEQKRKTALLHRKLQALKDQESLGFHEQPSSSSVNLPIRGMPAEVIAEIPSAFSTSSCIDERR